MGRPRILLADDLPEIRERVTELRRHDFHLIGIVKNGQAAVDAYLLFKPDLIVLDISMPILNGIQVASRLRDLDCRAKVVFLTVHEDPDYIDAAFSVGASGYVFKSRVATDLLPAVRGALEGHKFISVNGRRALREQAPLGHSKRPVATKRA